MQQGGEIIPDGSPQAPPLEETGWKDTAMVGPNEILRVVARFDDYTGLYAYHCHILEHEDHEMIRQFRVVPEPSVLLGLGTALLMLAGDRVAGVSRTSVYGIGHQRDEHAHRHAGRRQPRGRARLLGGVSPTGARFQRSIGSASIP